MFSDIDILNKELDNDMFRAECVVECITMDIDRLVDSEYITEAEGSGVMAAIGEKIKKVVASIIDAIKKFFEKIADFVQKKKLKAKYEELQKRAEYIQSQYGQVLEHSSEWQAYISDQELKYFDMHASLKDRKSIGDRAVAMCKNIASKISGGSKVSSSDITEIRNKVDEEQAKGMKSNLKEVAISKLSGITSALAHAGVVGGMFAGLGAMANNKFSNSSIENLYFRDTPLDLDKVGALFSKLPKAGFIAGASISAIVDLFSAALRKQKAKDRAEISPVKDQYGAALEYSAQEYSVISTAISSLGTALVKADSESYRQGIATLSEALTKVEHMLNRAEAIGKAADRNVNAADHRASEYKQNQTDKKIEAVHKDVKDIKNAKAREELQKTLTDTVAKMATSMK